VDEDMVIVKPGVGIWPLEMGDEEDVVGKLNVFTSIK